MGVLILHVDESRQGNQLTPLQNFPWKEGWSTSAHGRGFDLGRSSMFVLQDFKREP